MTQLNIAGAAPAPSARDDHAAPAPSAERLAEAAARAAELAPIYEELSALDALERALTQDFPGEIALVSSFGAESAVLLALAAEVDRSTPVLFGETGMHFQATRYYRRRLIERLGLRNVQVIRPAPAELARRDPAGVLNQSDTDSCCHIRKVVPLERALTPFSAWFTGRKRSQSRTRSAMAAVESDAAGRIKVNPLAKWTADDVAAFMAARDLPAHPLVAQGYPSIGCEPCTSPIKPGEDPRAGRWRNSAKTECGIHVIDGKIVRVAPDDSGPLDRQIAS
ncbi:MAG: phosphoadenylyl-sulfate reductase [Neomegalonema sp.]|nr:phosphoadenylyl-sulfate reductase [Neomegalonema sp.]